MLYHDDVPRVVLADNQPIARYGIRKLLESHNDARVVAEASSLADLLEILESMSHDVILANFAILDAHGGRGLDRVKRLRKAYPSSSMVLMVGIRNAGLLGAIMQTGVSGLIERNTNVPELRVAVRTAGKGKKYVSRRFQRALHSKWGEANDPNFEAHCLKLWSCQGHVSMWQEHESW
ncbi:response regulator [Dyella flagellata]|uniref:Response regulatory domain-containing protein n=1 Tax=Dyella flagellata TaxID=1867833 RepID=A0ABQ5X9G9_9GAMM|nr:response regulator [Dyella flagellata]GLQ87826.1 hypothetical protein GCM10007898_13940 [Dyella flagellata]